MPDADRPDPDQLLAKVQAEAAQSRRGKLKIFFGSAPGVGKTYAMLEAARKEAKTGADVIVGYVEPHARPETQALVLGLDVLPRKSVEYHGRQLVEFDLEAALARAPELLVVDELAHTNAPGSTHPKRWQDVEDLLAAGINVYTTLNVQHLESVNDVVAQITGITVRETVPDSIFDAADEVELVDLAPDDLMERLKEGRVYIPGQAERALANFFKKGNLIALRELALRRMAERVNAQVQRWREDNRIVETWPTAERLLVCVGPGPHSMRMVRATRRMAARMAAPWLAVHVETPGTIQLRDQDRQSLEENMRLAEELGAEAVTLAGNNAVEEVLRYARQRNVSRVIVGRPRQPRWKELISGSFVYELSRRATDVDVHVMAADGEPVRAVPAVPRRPSNRWPYVASVLAVAMCTAIGGVMFLYLGFAAVNIAMVYLIGVVIISVRYGQGPSILASILGVAAFDFFFIPPHLTFAVQDTQYLVTFAVMLLTGLVIATLTARGRQQAELAHRREGRTAALYALSRELAAVEDRDAIVAALVRQASAAFQADVAVLLPVGDVLTPCGLLEGAFRPEGRDEGVARWAFDHGEAAGLGSDTLPGADALYLPLAGPKRVLGVIGLRPRDGGRFLEQDQVHLAQAFAGQAAIALERTTLSQESENVRLQVQTERLRNSLLSAVSHDLRTPLAAIAGAASTILDAGEGLDKSTRTELLETISDESERLNLLVANLLDMTRLECGALVPNRDWHSLEELIGVVLHRLTRLLRDRPVKVRLADDLPLIYADGFLIEQVLTNLIENAAKYSPGDSPIDVFGREFDGRVIVEVCDRGPGLPEGEERKVFDKFYRASRGPGPSGVGLGLTICRGIMDLHSGSITAANREGGGSVFRIGLPIEEPSPQIAEEVTKEQ